LRLFWRLFEMFNHRKFLQWWGEFFLIYPAALFCSATLHSPLVLVDLGVVFFAAAGFEAGLDLDGVDWLF